MAVARRGRRQLPRRWYGSRARTNPVAAWWW